MKEMFLDFSISPLMTADEPSIMASSLSSSFFL